MVSALTMLAPHRRQLIGFSWAWAPGTDGPVTGDVVLLDARSVDDFRRRFAGRIAGKWVLAGPSTPIWNPDGPAMTARDSARFDSVRGPFKFNANQYPIQNYYVRTIGSDGKGGLINKSFNDPILKNHGDAYVQGCQMK